jgi:superfamily I DNA/RNA helicase
MTMTRFDLVDLPELPETMRDKLAGYLASLNPEQYAAVTAPIEQNTQVMAGAGTGKTHMMTLRAMVLMAQLKQAGHPNPAEALWIATFTDRAANELRERLDTMHRDIFGQPLPKNTWVGTFHSLSNRLLSRLKSSLTVDKLTDENVILQDIDLLLFQDALIERLLNDTVDNINDTLDLEYRARTTWDELLSNWELPNVEELVSEIVYRIIPRIKASGLSPEKFEDVALSQRRQFLTHIQDTPIREFSDDVCFSSVESAARVWSQHYAPYATPGFQFDTTPVDHELATLKAQKQGKSAPSELTQLKAALKPLSASGRFLAYDGRIRKGSPFSLLDSETSTSNASETFELARDEALISLISWVYRVYQKQLALEGVLDFDDLILETLSAFEKQKTEANSLRDQFKHFLIDEFQDTNGAQLALIQTVSQGQTPITVVGDIKQSIYGFRFAQPENLEVIFNTRSKPEQITLKTNYRSTPAILKVANQAAFLMSATNETDLYPNPDTKSDLDQPVLWHFLEDNPHSSEGWSRETQLIANEIAQLLQNDSELSPKDIAVLFPNHQKGLELEGALRAKQIPAVRQKALGFFDSPFINAVVSLLVWLNDANNDMAFMHLLQRHLADSDLLQLARFRRDKNHPNQSLLSYYQCFIDFETTEQDPTIASQNIEATKLLFKDTHKHLHDLPPHSVIKALIENPKILASLFPKTWQHQQQDQDADAIQHLQLVLTQWAQPRAGQPQQTFRRADDILKALLRAQERNELTLPLGSSETASNIDAVMLLTIHAAKGLEFPIVFYAGVENYRSRSNSQRIVFEPQYDSKPGFGLFLKNPNPQENDDIKSIIYKTFWEAPRLLKERQRLQYVGFTRAKKRLVIFSGPQSFKYENPHLFGDRIILAPSASEVPHPDTMLIKAI